MLTQIISGGQTGVDRAALDVALELGLPCGGWCPKGRRAEDGTIPRRYPLQETSSAAYPQRTALNVRRGDGTLVLIRGRLDRGTTLTARLARRYHKPFLIVDLDETSDPAEAVKWLQVHQVRVLNVAGPRESFSPGIGQVAARFLRWLFKETLSTKDAKGHT